MGWMKGAGSLFVVMGSLASSVACSTSSPSGVREGQHGELSQAVTGSNTQDVTSGASPWGGVGRLIVHYTECLPTCSNGQPPYRGSCGGAGLPTTVCKKKVEKCSGSLIARDLVLGAGHCFCEFDDEPRRTIKSVSFQAPGMAAEVDAEDGGWHYTKDDCAGTWEDDSSRDLAVVKLKQNVPDAEVNSPLLTPYLGDDVEGFLTNDYRSPSVAGWGGTADEDDYGQTLTVGKYDEQVGLDDDNWFNWDVSSGSEWIWMTRDRGAANHKGDSGGPFAVFKISEAKWYQIGVTSGSLGSALAQPARDLYSPTFNNGDGNGDWIAKFLDDADGDQVSDARDNCSPADARLNCFGAQRTCVNQDQADTDEDGIGDVCDNCPDVKNPSQANGDGDGFGDACDGCPYFPDGRHGDEDGDKVWDACDNCNLQNPYKSCTSDADCGAGVCRENKRCSLQLDDPDGDGVGGRCDRCPLVTAADLIINSNKRAESRENVGQFDDICDPVPIYVATPKPHQVDFGILPDPAAPERNAANTVMFEGSARVGHDVSSTTTPTNVADLPRAAYSGRVGFRFCSCQTGTSEVLPETQCFTRQCSDDPLQYVRSEAESNWRRLSVATSGLNAAPPSSDQPRGSEPSKAYSSDISTAFDFGLGLGARERLFWSFWKDLAATGAGGNVESRAINGVHHVDGLYWTHSLGSQASSSRDDSTTGKLRDTYQVITGPLFETVTPNLHPPIRVCSGGGCNPLLDSRIWQTLPDDFRHPAWLDQVSRVFPGEDGRIYASLGDRYSDITAALPSGIRELFGQDKIRLVTPTEATLDRLSRGLKTAFVSVESPWTATKPIREVVAAAGGTLDLLPAASGLGPIPGARVNARTVLAASERSVFLVGGERLSAEGVATPTGEIWRYDLDLGTWRRVGTPRTFTGAALRDLRGVSYDVAQRQLFVLGSTGSSGSLGNVKALQLAAIDTRSGTTRSLATLPTLANAERVSLTSTRDHTLVLAVQSTAARVDVYELNPTPSRPDWVGYAALDGRLDDDIVAMDDIRIPMTVGGVRVIRTLSRQTLATKTGSASVGDRDRDGIPDALDDCPDSFTAAGEGCPAFESAALYAGLKLTIADRVEVVGADSLAVSAGTGTTVVGVDAKIGTLRSKAPVTLRDRVKATGAVVSGGSISSGNGVIVSGGLRPNVAVALGDLATFSVAFPTAGGPISLEPDQNLDLAPGSYGAVSVKQRSTLRLAPGSYYFASLTLEPQSGLVVDSRAGVTSIYVKSALTFRGNVLEQASGTTSFHLLYFGTSTAPIESSFDGTLVAPNGKVVLASTKHHGSFFAKELEVQAGAQIFPELSRVSWYPVGNTH